MAATCPPTSAGDPATEQRAHQRATVDVVGGVEAERPAAAVELQPAEVVHQARDLELDVVGVRRAQPLGALQAVLEDREPALVVGVADASNASNSASTSAKRRRSHRRRQRAGRPRIASATRVRVGP